MKPRMVNVQVKVCRRCGAEAPIFSGPIAHYKDCPRNPAVSDQITTRNPPNPSATVKP
jgi:hypothetical protein